jgi:large subunit ribosomal protein L4
MKVNTYNTKGESVGTTELPERVFGVKWSPLLVKQVHDGELANKRRPWAHTKDRGDVRGGGKKPWRQKGLGRARHGSRRSPIWVGGGVTHGPINARDFSVKINKKMRRGAVCSTLSKKLKDKEIVVLDEFVLSKPKTKEAYNVFKNLRDNAKVRYVGVVGGKTLLLAPHKDEFVRAARNLTYVDIMEPRNVNTMELLRHKYVVLDKSAVDELKATLNK